MGVTLNFLKKKPYSAVTVAVERLTSEQYEEDELSGIPDLVEAIKLQATGPTEAARALRKKLKYGNVHRQLRALTIIDGLLQNAGSRFQRAFIDEPLLERLRVCGTSDLTDKEVRDKCKVLFASWAQEYKNLPGLEHIAGLYKQLPRRKQQVTQDRSEVLRETERDPFEDGADDEEDEEEPPSSSSRVAPRTTMSTSPPQALNVLPAGFPGTSFGAPGPLPKKTKKNKKSSKKKSKPFNLELEKGKMKSVIAESSVASINLLNALQLINREQERVSENTSAVQKFETCKMLRRHILRYIQHVEAEQWLGALINANDNLVTALMTFEQLDRSIDADSDSDDAAAEQAHLYRMATAKGKEAGDPSRGMANLNLRDIGSPPPVRPPRPTHTAQADDDDGILEEDENDPFGDKYAAATPATERAEPTW
ncbi:MAG: putative actin patch assembly and actin polymerization protein [Claussenomyces sp. TS43310]|nr:MAG: putative actin patch assembly and actin polymerization protein [Claussenomyces sp. TS43310]